MPPSSDLRTEFEQVQRSLLAPGADAMRDCERQLESLAKRIAHLGIPPAERQPVRRLVLNIRFLLDQANAFWQSRRRAIAPALEYSSSGLLSSHTAGAALNIEI